MSRCPAVKLTLQALDARELPSVAAADLLADGTLRVTADDHNTNAVVAPVTASGAAAIRVTDAGTGHTWSFDAARVSAVRFVGGAGSDVLIGGSEDDVLLGGAGNDQLSGNGGRDHLNGEAGSDSLSGGPGEDVLIALDGGAGLDVIWVDGSGGTTDQVARVGAGEQVQVVKSFANGADRTLDGDRLADPRIPAGKQYERFAGNPLFGPDGPRAGDVRQGDLGDCWLLAGLGAVAQDSPAAVRRRVVDFDDGTYGVRLGDSFYRVDDDLPVFNGAAAPAYAGLGAGGAMWVAVVEKAYTWYRTGEGRYGALSGGSGSEVNAAFGADAHTRGFGSFADAAALATFLANKWDARSAVSIGITTPAAGVPLVGDHVYTLQRVIRDASGAVTGLVLRNPWHVDGRGSDGTPQDGLVTVTPRELFRGTGCVYWGQVA